MKGTLHPQVKICCISSITEAQIAMDHGAHALGLVGNMPSGPGIISDDQIRTIAQYVPLSTNTFLLTSQTTTSQIIEHYNKVQTTTIQIVDTLTEGHYSDIKAQLPHVKLVQVIHVIDHHSIVLAKDVSEHVDAVLLDSGNPNLETKELGGTGRVHNWEISKTIREELEIPTFLAGGLNAKNVKDAILTVQPYGIDLCSGVRTNRVLDQKKLSAFFSAVNAVH